MYEFSGTYFQEGCVVIQTSAPTSVHTVLLVACVCQSANMFLMTQLLATRDDLKLLTANSGKGCVEVAVASQPDVIVMDTELPDVSARDVLAWLRKNPRTSHTPVIAVSSEAFQNQIDAGLKAGFYRYLTKPFKLTDLLDAIDNSFGYTMERFGPIAVA